MNREQYFPSSVGNVKIMFLIQGWLNMQMQRADNSLKKLCAEVDPGSSNPGCSRVICVSTKFVGLFKGIFTQQ